jgi:hypothetical protein
MSDGNNIYWIIIVGLIALGFVWGQTAAVSIAAMVALYLACDQAVIRRMKPALA